MGSIIEQERFSIPQYNDSASNEYEPHMKTATFVHATPSNKINIMNAPGTEERCNISEKINFSKTPKVFTD